MQLALWVAMTSTLLRTGFAAVLVTGGLGACARPARPPSIVGPELGESTAPGPAYPFGTPDAAGPTEVSAPLHGLPGPVASPAQTVETMPPEAQPEPQPANPAVVWAPGVPALPTPPRGAGSGGQPAPGMPPANSPSGPVLVAPPIVASPPPGTPPLAPPNGPGSGASPGAPRAAGPSIETRLRGASGTPPSTPGGSQR
jgi:hypothetical protein